MIRLPMKYRSDDDDYAPLDYQFVGSVAEGQRRRESEAIHRNEKNAVVRHRADPTARIDEYGTRARQSRVSQVEKPRGMERQLPSMEGGARVQRVAYPEDFGGREDAPAGEANELATAAGDVREWDKTQSGLMVSDEVASPDETPEAPEFGAPVAPEIPEWLRVAQQNNMPMENRHLRPRVTAVPKAEPKPTDLLGRPVREQAKAQPIATLPQTASDYAEAGYPPELLREQEQQDQNRMAEQYGSTRHGAQRVVRPDHNAGLQQRAKRAQQANEQSGYGRGIAQQSAARQQPLSLGEQEVMNVWSGAPQPVGPYDRREASANLDYAPRGYAPIGYEPASDPYARSNPHRRKNLNRRDEVPEASPEALPETLEWAETDPETIRRSIPWLGIATTALALIAVLLWILQMTFAGRTEDVLSARTQAEEAIAQVHPYKYRELIETQAQVNNLHPAFIAAIVLNESSFNPDAESSVGARGLMQVMPDTAEWVHGKIGEGANYDFDMMYDASTNVRYACWYMNFLSERFRGDPVLVAAAFHAGQGTVQNWLSDSRYSTDNQTIALENMMDGPTKNYATRVLKAYAVYKRLYYENMGV